ncbi:hypothetical protein BD779DRAFT_1788507 [Infundibulicybe gibba]|nr:hypothetical protein BD779DRAFT_1788507 [Infundibulicybe gibba]
MNGNLSIGLADGQVEPGRVPAAYDYSCDPHTVGGNGDRTFFTFMCLDKLLSAMLYTSGSQALMILLNNFECIFKILNSESRSSEIANSHDRIEGVRREGMVLQGERIDTRKMIKDVPRVRAPSCFPGVAPCTTGGCPRHRSPCSPAQKRRLGTRSSWRVACQVCKIREGARGWAQRGQQYECEYDTIRYGAMRSSIKRRARKKCNWISDNISAQEYRGQPRYPGGNGIDLGSRPRRSAAPVANRHITPSQPPTSLE